MKETTRRVRDGMNKLYFFTYIKGIPHMVQPVYAGSHDEAESIIVSRYGNSYANCYTDMQWPVIEDRMEKRLDRKLTILDPINLLPEGA